MPPRRHGSDDHEWEDSPTGSHRRPLGSDGPWQEKDDRTDRTDPTVDAHGRGAWWAKPVTLPWGMLLAIGGVGAGGAGTTMFAEILIPDEVVTEAELERRLERVVAEEATRRQATERKLDAISDDIADLHDDVDALNDILEKAFPRFPTRRDP